MTEATTQKQKRRERQLEIMEKMGVTPRRNDALYDTWSIVHLLTGLMMGWLMSPFIALALLVLWEPLEILILSPFLARFGILFGYESLRNALSDIFFDVIGVALGAWAFTAVLDPPFFLF